MHAVEDDSAGESKHDHLYRRNFSSFEVFGSYLSISCYKDDSVPTMMNCLVLPLTD